ncbi:hypothetical protein [Dermacoccus sp. Tok2021]|nr:hypothetical protein [Dermacoccus sp. Tok2021]
MTMPLLGSLIVVAGIIVVSPFGEAELAGWALIFGGLPFTGMART